ncbi:MAG: AAA family ATPase, partial [Bdellovibrionales bacterium]|nr:AAA family ATPase [Bdellovibrionales bacterium]
RADHFLGPRLSSGLGVLRETSRAILRDVTPEINDRISRGLVIDGHGDLRLEHIRLLEDRIDVIDCIEFSDAFRTIDVLNDVAFLSMELTALGYERLAGLFLEHYLKGFPDAASPQLLGWFSAYRAMVRVKVGLMRLEQLSDADDAHAQIERVERLIGIAGRSLVLSQPMIIATAGLMGVGKSSIAEGLAQLLSLSVIATDAVRHEVFADQFAAPDAGRSAFGAGLYTADARGAVYEAVRAKVSAELSQGRSVIVDASFSEQDERSRMRALGREHGAKTLFIHCVLDDAVLRERLRKRSAAHAETPSLSDGRIELLDSQKAAFAEFAPDEPVVVVDTSQEIAEQLRAVFRNLTGK